MPDYTPFLLYTDQQSQEFRRRYATFIGQKRASVANWINSLPVMERIDYLKSVPERNIPAVIGLLCHLLDSGAISITFVEQARRIYRNPTSTEEWKAWCDSLSSKRKIIKK